MCGRPLEYVPRTQSVYSDLGFMLLGFILEDVGRASLATQFTEVSRALGEDALLLGSTQTWAGTLVPTEFDPWRGRMLVGDVHDENAWALGGAAGHAGLFGTAAGVGAFARSILRAVSGEPGIVDPETLSRFLVPSGVRGSFARARLGYDASHFFVRTPHVDVGVWPHGLHRNVPLAGPRTRCLRPHC